MAEDDDFAAMRRYKEESTNGRISVFNEVYLDKLIAKGYVVTNPSVGKITIVTFSDYGVVDYFPKANKVLIRKYNEWVEGGNGWIRKKLINEEQQNK